VQYLSVRRFKAMKVAVLGLDGPLARATRAELERRGHTIANESTECAILFPGNLEQLRTVAGDPGLKRLVLRSHGYAYGSNPKNPGMMTEDRISLLPPKDPAQRWLQAEAIAQTHPNAAVMRLANVADPAEGDLIPTKLGRGWAAKIAGFNPNVQFVAVDDAARALVAAAESQSAGLFNAAGAGALPLADAFRAAGTHTVGVPKTAELASMQFNWTLSSGKAARELGWQAQKSSVAALAELVARKGGGRPELLTKDYDDWGLDTGYIRAWGWWFAFLRNIYWRIDFEGMENIPQTGRALFISNHRGFMPLDAVMHLSLIFTHRNRVPRFLIIHSLLRTPFLCDFLTKLGGVIASEENAARLFEKESLVGLFPEGIRGTFTPYNRTHKLRDFSRSDFAKLAVLHQAPVIPAAVVGHAEIFPIIGRIDSSWVVKELGWPYLPIAPMFPLAPIPLPSKWHVRILKPVPLDGLKPADSENARLMKEFSRYVQNIVQKNVDDMAARRKSVIRGHFLDGTSPSIAPFSRARVASGSEPAE
jgi:1-acyl-sn-glycerol-3-phosphate acyltransferase